MGWNIKDIRPGLAQRIFDQMANKIPAAKPSNQPVARVKRQASNRSNDGRPFQNRILATGDAYRALGVLRLAKVDAPTKFIGGKVICIENPWPDFVGVFSGGGRMLALEAKSTAEDRLGFNVKAGGLTIRQVTLLINWGEAGAASGVIWEVEGKRCLLIGWRTLKRYKEIGSRSLKFAPETGALIKRGAGFVVWDFADELKRLS